MQNKGFVVFILSHGRPNNIYTLKALKKWNYTGDYYIVCDNEDNTIDTYYKNFGRDRVIVFDKLAISKTFDTFDLSEDRRTIVYARNACFDIAKKLGYQYFLELDDDYKEFQFRFPQDNKLKLIYPLSLDDVFDAMLDYYKSIDAKTIAFAQGGDFIGGLESRYSQKVLRKAMNTFFCDIDRPFKFIGRINEDVNTYCLLGSQGDLFLTITDMMINQVDTQQNDGGMSNIYNSLGTYNKSFYTIICNPSSVKINIMGDKHYRVHHSVNWETTVPKIISSKFKK